MQANGELMPGVEEQTRQALVNMGHLLQVSIVNMVEIVSRVNTWSTWDWDTSCRLPGATTGMW